MTEPLRTTITPELDAQMRGGIYRAVVGRAGAAPADAPRGAEPADADAPRRLKVFLSHSSPDKALARRLARDLQSAQVEVWLDQWQIGVGESFEQRIAQGLANTDFVVVLLTRQAVASEWVSREWREMVEREQSTRRIAVLPVRAEACALPDFLAQRSHADISGGSYVPGFRQLLHLLRHYGDERGVALADKAARAEAQRRRTHLLEVERVCLDLEMAQDALQLMLPVVAPIGLEVSHDLIPLVEPDADGVSRVLDELVPQVRDALAWQYGYRFPGVRVRGDTEFLPTGTALVLVDELIEHRFSVDPQQLVVDATPEQLAAQGVPAKELHDRACGRIACVPLAQREALQRLDLATMDAQEYLAHVLFETLRSMPQAFLHMDEVRRLLEALPSDLVQRTVPARVSWVDLTRILRALLEEEVGIGDLRAIVEALSRRDLQNDGFDACVEIARRAVSAQIAQRFLLGQQALSVLTASAALESCMLDALQPMPEGNLLALDPQVMQQLLAAVREPVNALGDAAGNLVLLVADSRIRPFLRRLVMLEFPGLHVLSRQELPPGLALEHLGEFGIEVSAP